MISDMSWPIFVFFLLYGCMVDVCATLFVRNYALEEDCDFDSKYQPFRFHQFWLLRNLLGKEAVVFMNRRSLFFPFIEIALALFLVKIAHDYGIFSIRMYECIFCVTILIIASEIDIKMWIYPEIFTYMLIIFGLIFAVVNGFFFGWDILIYRLSGGFYGFGLVYIFRQFSLWVFKRDGFGIGDIYMFTGLGLFLGWDMTAVLFFMSPFFGLPIAFIYLIIYKATEIPTGTYYIFPFLICLMYSNQIKAYFLASFIEVS